MCVKLKNELARWLFYTSFLAIWGLSMVSVSHGQVSSGGLAPIFSLKDGYGNIYDLSSSNFNSPVILCFLDLDLKSSHKGLIILNRLIKTHKRAALTVWGIASSSADRVKDFVETNQLHIPILVDTKRISDQYGAGHDLPTVCVVGPQQVILDYHQQGDTTYQALLIQLARRYLQLQEADLAQAFTSEVIATDPGNIEAKVVSGYAAVEGGDLRIAQNVFERIANGTGQFATLGKEGLMSVYLSKGETQLALSLAKKTGEEFPDRIYPFVVRGIIYYGLDRKGKAISELEKAAEASVGSFRHKTLALNLLGRVYSELGDYERATSFYDRALAIDPFYLSARCNRAVALEAEGDWAGAVSEYRTILDFNDEHVLAGILIARAERMLGLDKEMLVRERMDNYVLEMTNQYTNLNPPIPQATSDKKDLWASPPIVLALLTLEQEGGLVESDGVVTAFLYRLADHFRSSHRLQVVDMYLVEALAKRLNLSPEKIIIPANAQRLGETLGATFIGYGSLYHMSDKTVLNFTLIDMHRGEILKTINSPIDISRGMSGKIKKLYLELLRAIVVKNPLRGHIVQWNGNEIKLDIGSKHGVMVGATLEVVTSKEADNFLNDVSAPSAFRVGELEVVRVESDSCYARILTSERPLRKNDRVLELTRSILTDRGD